MKTLTVTLLAVLLASVGFSQSSLRIYTKVKDKEAKFLVYLNGDKQDAVYMNEIKIEDLDAGQYELTVKFNDEKIADFVEKIEVGKKKKVVYKVVKTTKFRRKKGELGREFGHLFGKTNDDDKKGLKEVYTLERISK